MMIPIAIISIIAGMIIPGFVTRSQEARRTKALVQMKIIISALESYRNDNGQFPTTRQGLGALVEKPVLEPVPEHWRQYLERIPRDPWRNEYVYKYQGAKARYILFSRGSDGLESEDDIIPPEK